MSSMTKALALLTLINILCYLHRYLTPALLPVISFDRALSSQEQGYLVSAFVAGYFISSPLFGILGDRFNRTRLMAWGMMVWGVGSFFSGWAHILGLFLLTRIIFGIGESCFATIAPAYLKDTYSDTIKLNRAFSVFFAAIPIGSALGYVAAASLVNYIGWQGVFVVTALPLLLLAPLMLAMPEVRTLSTPKSLSYSDLRVLLCNPILMLAILGYVFNSFALNGIASFVTKFGMQIGFELERIGQIFGIILVATGFAGTVLGGLLASRLAKGHRHPGRFLLRFSAWSGVAAFPLAALSFCSSNRELFLIACSFTEVLVFAGVAPINSVITSSPEPRHVAMAQGLTIFAINCFGAMLAPVIVGAAADSWGLPIAMQLCSAALLLSGVVWFAAARLPWREAA